MKRPWFVAVPVLVPVLALSAVAASFSGCNCGNPVVPPAGDLCGTGTVDGAPYAIDPAATRLVIVVLRNDGAGCGVFHNHVVNAKIAKLEYALDSQNPAQSTFVATVRADGLDPDSDALRDEFLTGRSPPVDGKHLSDGDRQSIRGSVADEVIAKDNPTLVFTISGISSAEGDGTASMKADLAGATSTVDVKYKVTKSADSLTIKNGTATLPGAPYGIPRNSLGFCVNPTMEVHFDLALTKAAATPVCDIGVGAQYTPQVFGDDACAPSVSYNQAREVAVKRCAGCHAESQILGATVRLVQWDDWRTDSVRNPGKPLYQTASTYIHADPGGGNGLAMPPIQDGLVTPLTADEIALFDAWVADGARNAKCAGDVAATVFPAIAHKAHDAFAFDVADSNASAQGATAYAFFDNNCGYCHADRTDPRTYIGVPQISAAGAPLDPNSGSGNAELDHAIGQAPVHHGYYQGDDGALLSFWEAGMVRYLDNSMPPGGAVDVTAACANDGDCAASTGACFLNPAGFPALPGGAAGVCTDPSFIAYADWVLNGYAETP